MQLELYHYLLIGGGAGILVAFLVYFLAGDKAKIPGTVAGVIAGLVVGAGAGMLVMVFFGYSLSPPDPAATVGIPVEQRASSWTPPKGLGGPPAMKPPEGSKMPEGMDQFFGAGRGGKPKGAKPQPEKVETPDK